MEIILETEDLHNALNQYIQQQLVPGMSLKSFKINWVKGEKGRYKVTAEIERGKPTKRSGKTFESGVEKC